MTTTAIFAEVLAIGVQTAIILGIALSTIVDLGPLVSGLEEWIALTTIGAVAITYVLGVAVDRLADSILGSLRRRTKRHDSLQFGEARLRVLERSSPVSSFLEYQRSRMRLMRGTVFNLVIAIPVVNLALVNSGIDAAGAYALANLALVVAVAACWFAYVEIGAAQDRWLDLVARSGGTPVSPGRGPER